MAGNVYEYLLECEGIDFRRIRGGNLYGSGAYNSANFRYGSLPDKSNSSNDGFRAFLYIK